MDIRSFTHELNPEQRAAFVEKSGTSTAYLSQLVGGHRKASANLARKMVAASRDLFPRETSRWLTLHGIRPDIWTPDEAA